ncbi:hypothetical protein [Alkalihalobacterium elongatum]|uniref:hypothetical protein n=1 Tax=Alkalihalobacterium elongatum TaxID=2675466 RepID=UPI001C1F2951|nr:hypothetical protein [Alkalihalobacterium elongatum]
MTDYSDLQFQNSNELSTDFQELHSEAKEHLLNSKAKNTQRAYASEICLEWAFVNIKRRGCRVSYNHILRYRKVMEATRRVIRKRNNINLLFTRQALSER